jgi:hypothetical protein
MDYYVARKRKKLLIHATTWMNLKNKCCHKRPHGICLHIHEVVRIDESTEKESRLVAPRGWGED